MISASLDRLDLEQLAVARDRSAQMHLGARQIALSTPDLASELIARILTKAAALQERAAFEVERRLASGSRRVSA